MKRQGRAEDDSEEEGGGLSLSSLVAIFHALWLKRWLILTVWVAVSLPTGLFLSIVDLPQSYRVAMMMRFPSVIGAQTSVMRDVAITEKESIVGIFNSFQVLERTVKALGLQLRVENKNLFPKHMFRHMAFAESAPLGAYRIEKAGDKVAITLFPRGGGEAVTVYGGVLPPDGHMEGGGLVLDWLPFGIKALELEPIELSLTDLVPVVETMRKNLRLNAMGSNLEVSLEDRDPFLVAHILNALAEEFLRVYYGTTEVQEVGVLAQMEKDVELAKKRLDESQNEVARYYREHPELSQVQEATPTDNMALITAQTDLVRIESQLEKLEKSYAAKPPDPASDQGFFWMTELLGTMSEAGDARAPILRAGLSDMRVRAQKVEAEVGPTHPRRQEVADQKAAFITQVEDAYRPLRSSLQGKVAGLRAKVGQLGVVRHSGPSVKSQLELQRLTEVNRNNQDIYNRLQESYNRAKLVTGSEFFKVTIVDPARPALYKPPSRTGRLTVAGFTVAVLIFAVLAAFGIFYFLMRKIWTKDDIKTLLGVRALGTVPEGHVTLPKPEEKSAHPLEPLLLFYGRSHTLSELESYRLIREEAEGYFKNSDTPGKLCLMVTSTQPGEGKTLISSNLALTFARKGKRTLLVDADFRLGRVAKAFNSAPSTGLDEMLSQADLTEAEFIEAATLCFVPSMQKDLILVPRKIANPNAGEMVSSDKFKAFLRLAREQFDVVIIDTPPVGITPEPLGLLEDVDGVVFACRSGVVSASDAKEAIQLLGSRNVKIGAVLNGLHYTPFEDNRYRKYAYYHKAGQAAVPKKDQEGSARAKPRE